MNRFHFLHFRAWAERSIIRAVGLFALCVLLLGLSVSSQAQPSKLYRVGLVSLESGVTAEISGLRDGLKEAGYVEGKNLVFDIGIAKTYAELRPIVRSYLEKKFDVIVTSGASAPLVAKEATQHIPIVFIGGDSPTQIGLVKSIARPEGNITGIAHYRDVELYGKRLEIFKEALPHLRRVTVIYNARGENPTHLASLGLIHKVAPQLGLTVIDKPIKVVSDIEKTLSEISSDKPGGLFPICSTLFRDSNQTMATFALAKKLALTGCNALAVTDFGALLYYGADTYRLGQRSAWYVDRLLKGTKPQDLPVEAPSYFEMIINLNTAKQIGVKIPPQVLARADRVIR